MSEENGLLAAIWEYPHEDAPRLVYSDWLEDHGNEARAEFIRVQCELAAMDPDNPESKPLQEREARLWKGHGKAWKTGLPNLLKAAPFQRGFPFPRRRAVTGNQFLKLSSSDLAPAPLWNFRINQAQKTIARVVASACMSRVGILEILPQQISKDAASVLSAANFTNISDLHLSANWIGNPGITALAANPSVACLRNLSVHSSDLDDGAIASLVSAPWFGALRSLELGNNSFDSPGLMSVVKAATSGNLRDLSVRGLAAGHKTRFDDESLEALFQAPHLKDLRGLDLGINYRGDRLIELLCSKGTTLQPGRLHLDNNSLTDRGIELLAGWPGLSAVERLFLCSNSIGVRGARALAESPHLTGISVLWLMHTPIASGNAAAQRLLRDRFGEAVKFDFTY